MKRKAKLFLKKAINSFILSVDHFNKTSDDGRIEAVLILLQHSFEMLLKASLVERGARIQQSGDEHTLSFEKCINKAHTEGEVRFLADDEVFHLKTLYSLRNAAQHSLLDISEQQLYLHAQTGLTLFRDILKTVFGEELSQILPARVLPISTQQFDSIQLLYREELDAVKSLIGIGPRKRKRVEAFSRLRPLAILDATLQGKDELPSDKELENLADKIRAGADYDTIFPNISHVQITTDGSGTPLYLRFSKQDEAVPVRIVSEGTEGAQVMIKPLNDTDKYSMGLKKLKEKVGLNQSKCLAVIRHLDLQSDDEYYKEFVIGKSRHKRYSPKAITRIKEALPTLDMEKVWEEHRPKRKKK